jgi:hypothetical protein
VRKLYNEFFYIPKHGKVREKVMLTRIAMTVTIVIMCLAAMSITAYAYFSYNITSGSNIIKAANFEANVSITDSNNDPVTVTKDGKVQTANLDAGKYTIELTKGNSTADTGFCVISIGDKTYYTDQICVDVKKDLTDATVKFDLWLSSPTKLEVLSHWGTSVYYGYGDDGRTEIFIVSDATVDLTTNTTSGEGQSETGTDQSEETTTTSTNTTTGTESPSTQTSESTTTPSTEPSSTTTEPATQTTEPAATEPASTESTTETQSVTENEETTGATTTEANE